MKLRLEYRDVGWWYWLVSWALVISGLAGWERGFYLVIGLSFFQIVHYAAREKSATAFPVQVRIAFFIFTLLAFAKPLRFLYFIPAIGLAARVLVDYCCMARLISLLPWNRSEPLSLNLIKQRIFSPPVDGSIQDKR